MPAHDTYLLHIYRSRAVSGWQWAARLESLPGGESWRFNDPEALLAHLRSIAGPGDPAGTPTEIPPDAGPPAASLMEGGIDTGARPLGEGSMKGE